MSWLDEHIEEFVVPQLYQYESQLHAYRMPFDPAKAREYLTPLNNSFSPEELTVIKNSWRSIKREANGKTVILPGRDVFIYEILARRENYPTIFIPECSRMTVRYYAKTLPQEHKDCYLFDTGFAGSIPKALGTQNFKLLSHHMPNSVERQVFPRLTLSRHLALKIEETPKYWESGRMRRTVGGIDIVDPKLFPDIEEKPFQPMSHAREFLAAARLTVAIYTNSAPKFINRHKPLVNRERRY